MSGWTSRRRASTPFSSLPVRSFLHLHKIAPNVLLLIFVMLDTLFVFHKLDLDFIIFVTSKLIGVVMV